ncbi:hypothetical protein TorRG33x02_253270 [Trema orientale]|uniref:Uncharacterized protein n=1 Tax=Trema orientale TaxID=63057 RepID=A0A2P5DF09_TREOI|nr:hypothetical protein TorRG33x02_253270 [Trema orientale]
MRCDPSGRSSSVADIFGSECNRPLEIYTISQSICGYQGASRGLDGLVATAIPLAARPSDCTDLPLGLPPKLEASSLVLIVRLLGAYLGFSKPFHLVLALVLEVIGPEDRKIYSSRPRVIVLFLVLTGRVE